MKCRVTNVCEKTLGDGTGPNNNLSENEIREPFVFGQVFGNRGPGGFSYYMWKAEDGSFAWEKGTPPVKCGKWFEKE